MEVNQEALPELQVEVRKYTAKRTVQDAYKPPVPKALMALFAQQKVNREPLAFQSALVPRARRHLTHLPIHLAHCSVSKATSTKISLSLRRL